MQALNLILLTAPELAEMRSLLKQSLLNPAGRDLFVSLSASWCHSAIATVSLCLLGQVKKLRLQNQQRFLSMICRHELDFAAGGRVGYWL